MTASSTPGDVTLSIAEAEFHELVELVLRAREVVTLATELGFSELPTEANQGQRIRLQKLCVEELW